MNTSFLLRLRYLGILCLVMLCMLGCETYENGPWLSLASREGRVTNQWQTELVSRNDILESGRYTNYMIDFLENGTFEWAFTRDSTMNFALTGKWELASADQQVKLIYQADTLGTDKLLYMDILRLKKDELWLDYFLEGDFYSLRLIPR